MLHSSSYVIGIKYISQSLVNLKQMYSQDFLNQIDPKCCKNEFIIEDLAVKTNPGFEIYCYAALLSQDGSRVS